jgi:hypothetical protein
VSEADNLPAWTGRPGEYEVWFLTISDPGSGNGYWIRSTLSSPVRGVPTAGVWFARFDRSNPEDTFGLHRAYERWALEEGRFHVRVGGATMSSGVAAGSVEAAGHAVSWDLRFPTGEPTYRLLPDWLYRSRLAPTKPFSPNVRTRVAGSITVDGASVELEDAPSQQGHLYGSRHAERWAWAHCSDFLDDDAVLHAVTAQGRGGPFTTPFFTFAGLQWEGQWIRFTKVRRRCDFGLGTWKIYLAGRPHRLPGRIEAPSRAMLRARYTDPSGELRFCHNSEIASCRLALFERKARGFEQVALLESRGTTHAEWAGRSPAHVVEREVAEAATEAAEVA